jgi:hypothetical protein
MVDNACAPRILKKHQGADAQTHAAKHTLECALMDDCKASGFGLFIDGVFHKFDAAGNKKALAWLGTVKKKDGLSVVVKGTMNSDTIAVSEISGDTK